MGNKRIESEVTKYEDGSRTVVHITMDKKGRLRYNTYNISSDNKQHDHTCQIYDGKDLKYIGGH